MIVTSPTPGHDSRPGHSAFSSRAPIPLVARTARSLGGGRRRDLAAAAAMLLGIGSWAGLLLLWAG
jgi:hypothetical protein